MLVEEGWEVCSTINEVRSLEKRGIEVQELGEGELRFKNCIEQELRFKNCVEWGSWN